MRPKSYIDNKLCDRFISVMSSLGLTQIQFAEKLSIRQASVSEIKNHKMEPTIFMVKNLLEEANIDGDWLLTGRGSMQFDKNLDCEELLQKQEALTHSEDSFLSISLPKYANSHETVEIPHLGVISDGRISCNSPNGKNLATHVPKVMLASSIKDFYALTVSDHSLAPECLYGDILIMQYSNDLRNCHGKIVVVQTANGQRMKEFIYSRIKQQIIMRDFNDKIDDLIVKAVNLQRDNSPVKILSFVIGRIRYSLY